MYIRIHPHPTHRTVFPTSLGVTLFTVPGTPLTPACGQHHSPLKWLVSVTLYAPAHLSSKECVCAAYGWPTLGRACGHKYNSFYLGIEKKKKNH